MDLFENLQIMNESLDNELENIITKIQNTFKCDIDDVNCDTNRCSFVVYNVTSNRAGDIEDTLKSNFLDYEDVDVSFEKDDSYLSPIIKSAYKFNVKLIENSQKIIESINLESEVDYSILKQNGIDFFENGAGIYRIVTPDDDKLDIEIEIQNDNGITKYFVSLPSEDVKTVDADLTSAILTVVNKLSGPPFKENVEKSLNNDEEKTITEAKSSSKSNISKMTYKGQKIQNQDWAEYKVGTYVEVINPLNNKSLDIKMGISGYGKLAGKVKDTYVYNDGSDNLTSGGSNHNYGELNPSAEQSCIIEVHDDFKTSQHGDKTNRIIIPVECLKEISEKEYKDIVNKIPRKGLNKLFNKNKKRIEATILKDEKDMEQIVENKETLTEDSADPKEALQDKADKFGAMIDALGEEMNEYELNEFLKGLTDELDMDIYEDGEPYPTDLDGYFAEPVAGLNLNDEADAEMFDWIDDVLTDCINKTVEYIKGRIETLKGEISALETTISDFESLI